MLETASFPLELRTDDRWFVYLLAAMDCSAFKVGFSCKPLQRIYSFSHRYFERFDLTQSRLLCVDGRDTARALEAGIKTAFAEHRMECPSWVLPQAGGDTEWFSPVYFQDAEARLESHGPCAEALLEVEELIREELTQARPFFESWALAQANAILRARSPHERAWAAAELRTLRDWRDAYQHFAIPVFIDHDEAREFLNTIVASDPPFAW